MNELQVFSKFSKLHTQRTLWRQEHQCNQSLTLIKFSSLSQFLPKCAYNILSLSYINPYDIFYFIRSSVFDLLRGNFLLNNNNLILCLLVSLRSISPKCKIHCNCFELNAALRTVNAIVEEYIWDSFYQTTQAYITLLTKMLPENK